MSFQLDHPSLVDLLKWRSLHQADRLAVSYLANGETETERLTYFELDAAAKKIAGQLQALNLKNAFALLLYNSGIEFVKAFFGCLYAGVIAVPSYVPKSKQLLQKIENIAEDCHARIILTTQDLLLEGDLKTDKLNLLIHLATDTLDNQQNSYQPIEIDSHATAFIQYTSGSTSQPKGVVVSHKNIIANQHMLQYAFRLSEHSVGVTWLPLFHDMGLIASLLSAIFVGYPIYVMPPSAFVRNPSRWLQCISQYKGTYTCAPNFAYDLCVKKITHDMRMPLDLRSLKTAVTAAEPIQPSTIKDFIDLFAECGFNKDAFTPSYGLAEATVFVAGKQQQQVQYAHLDETALQKNKVVYAHDPQQSQVLVSCGTADYLHQRVVIVDPNQLVACKNDIGEIWVAGPHIAEGYLNKPELSREVFKAHLSDYPELTFLRTGDLGFVDKTGELFITGRIKDLIIINGSNYYPQDIELTVERVLAPPRKNSIAVFSVVIDQQEQLIVVVEIKQQLQPDLQVNQLASQINIALLAANQPTAYEVIFIDSGTLPKTTSGKIQRQACKAEYRNNQLNIVGKWVSHSNVAQKTAIINCIISFIAKNKNIAISNITPLSNIADFNIDSIQFAELTVALEQIIKTTVPVKLFYENATIQNIVDVVLQLPAQHNIASPAKVEFNNAVTSNRKIAIPKFVSKPPATELSKG